MMNLSTVSNLTKKYFWALGLLVFAVIFAAIIYFQFTFKPSDKGEPISPPSLENLQYGASFDVRNLKVSKNQPSSLPAYQNQNVNLLEKAADISSKLGFSKSIDTNDINLGQGLIYSNAKASLSIYPSEIFFLNYPEKTASSSAQPLSEQTLKAQSENFFSSLGLASNFSQNVQIEYYIQKDEFTIKTFTPEESDLTKLNFQYQLENLPLIIPKSEVSTTFDKWGNLRRATYTPLTPQKTSGSYPLIPAKDALTGLLQGRGSLIKISASNTYTPPSKSLGTIKLKEEYLAYYLPAGTKEEIQPVWIFIGQTDEDPQTDIYYAVPAINPNYLKP